MTVPKARPPFFRTTEYCIAQIDLPVVELASRLGVAVEEWIEDGLGPAQTIGVHLRSGYPIMFQRLLYSPAGLTDVYADAGDVSSSSVDAMLVLVIADIGIDVEAVRWRQTAPHESIAALARQAEDYQATTAVWTVFRIDDNGNSFVVAEELRRWQAEELVAEFAAKGHTQLYWAERGKTGVTL